MGGLEQHSCSGTINSTVARPGILHMCLKTDVLLWHRKEFYGAKKAKRIDVMALWHATSTQICDHI